jgi:hypothetical protein
MRGKQKQRKDVEQLTQNRIWKPVYGQSMWGMWWAQGLWKGFTYKESESCYVKVASLTGIKIIFSFLCFVNQQFPVCKAYIAEQHH